MTEQELRALVRDAIASQLGGHTATVSGTHAPSHVDLAHAHRAPAGPSTSLGAGRVSFSLFVVPTGSDADGPCIIEPAVPCNHCGYCRSYGH